MKLHFGSLWEKLLGKCFFVYFENLTTFPRFNFCILLGIDPSTYAALYDVCPGFDLSTQDGVLVHQCQKVGEMYLVRVCNSHHWTEHGHVPIEYRCQNFKIPSR